MPLGLTLDRTPELREPALIVGFAGWTDAGEAASAATRWLVRRLPAQRFASIDAEPYHNFTSTRPTVRMAGGERRITWPLHDCYFHSDPEKPRDLAILVAREPELRWRTYADTVIELARAIGATTIITLGAFLGDALHSRPVPLSGFASTPDLVGRLEALEVSRSAYEGPTGMASVLLDHARRADLTAASLWAAVPQYLPQTANPKAALALVRAASGVLGLNLDLSRLEAAAAFFIRQVEEAIANDRRATAFVRELERRAESEEAEPQAPSVPLPSADEVIRDLEAFLRSHRGDDGED